jgi:CRP-like cAMP-binding protein
MPLNLMERVIFLRSTELGKGLPDPALKVIAEVAHERDYQPGQVLFAEEALGVEMYLIIEGSVDIRTLGTAPPADASGDALGAVLSTLGPGDVVGEMSVLDDRPRSASVVAQTAVSALSIHREDLRDAIALCPDLAFGFFRILSARLRATSRSLSTATDVRPPRGDSRD